ncbi:hypothetical protein [Endozoicomonas sp. SCSIO W0465]|uniref:hypothetical protein n=1 Tax=Endozoicomonas sp. SCSIO W0465 TaxID=2918516 RepID=UPI0020761619|nr:hypothetical protein [Endozoicomonas sp. SCSIO W0465]USE34849.1 hypothetical protein MJO57_22360 [Endozoicomonas sp. SCSIO W0465]
MLGARQCKPVYCHERWGGSIHCCQAVFKTDFLHVFWQRHTEKAKVVAFLKLGCLKEGWQGIDEAVKDHSTALVTTFPPCVWQRLTGKGKVEAFLKLGA